ncbi:MAG: NAD(P)-binding domain-containing protein [Nocardioides sp.]|uniref:NADPH-dependent F420 reductase n=1 Tax=Nocardioides sp. TaxID=35761 RepID=UPI0039E56497
MDPVVMVGIVGSGNIGAGVARMATAADLPVVVANSRGPETLDALISELGPSATAATVEDAVARADLVVLALPFGASAALPAASLSGKVVIDATNYYPDRDGHVPALDAAELTSSELLARQWPDAQVVKGLNNVDFLHLPMLPRPAGADDRTALPIAGDDGDAKARVVTFLDAIGFDALDLGALAEGWRSQPGSPVYVTPYYRESDEPDLDPRQRFMTAEPTPVPLETARALASEATR